MTFLTSRKCQKAGLAVLCVALLFGCGPSNNSSSPDPVVAETDMPPIASVDKITTAAGVNSAISVLDNDQDPEGHPLKIENFSTGTGGQLVLNDAGTPDISQDDYVVFQPDKDFVGNVTFSYTITDAAGNQASSEIQIQVVRREGSAGNRTPVANNDSINGSSVMSVDVLSNDFDSDNQTLAISQWSQPTNGTVAADDAGTPGFSSDDRLTYTPNAGFEGQDSFVYTITDGIDTASASVVVRVSPLATPISNANVFGRAPVSGASISIYRIDQAGHATGSPLMQTVTDAGGQWDGKLDRFGENLLVVARGGYFLDDTRGLKNAIAAEGPGFKSSHVLETVLLAGQSNATLTILSNALLLHARYASVILPFDDALARARDKFNQAFGFDPMLSTLRRPLLPVNAFADAQHLMILGGVANQLAATAIKLSQSQLTAEMVLGQIRDLSDCILDGRDLYGPVQLAIAGINLDFPAVGGLEIASLRYRNNYATDFGRAPPVEVNTSACAIADLQAPVFSTVPALLSVAAVDAAGTPASDAAITALINSVSALDNGQPIAVSHNAPSVFPLGTTTITFTATDAQGNQSSVDADVQVSDQTRPQITAPGSITATRTGVLTQVSLGIPVVSDNVSNTNNIVVTNNAPANGFVTGVTLVTWTATDGAGLSRSASQVVNIQGNDSPTVVAPLADVATSQNNAVSINTNVAFTDPNNDTLTFTVLGLPAASGFSVNAATGVISGTPTNSDALASPLLLIVVASDGVFDAAVTLTIIIVNTNDAPILLTPLSDIQLTEDVQNNFSIASTFTDPDNDILTFSATGLPPTLVMNATTGVITGQIDDSAVLASPYQITVTASDGTLSVSDTFELTAIGINDSPQLKNPLGTVSAIQNSVFSLNLGDVFSDDDNDALNLSITGLPPSLTLDPDQIIRGTPTNDNALVGSFGLSLTANDGNGGSANHSFLLVVNNVNDAPQIAAALGNQNAVEDTPFSLDVRPAFTDIDGDTLTYSSSGLPASMTLNSSGLLSGTPTNADAMVSPFSVTVTATDPGGLNVSVSFSLNISNTNDAPVISSIADPAAGFEDTMIGPLGFTISDLETAASALTITATSSNPGIVSPGAIVIGGSGTNRTVTITPTANVSGSAQVTLRVSDGSAFAESLFNVSFASVNDAPAFTVGADLSLLEDFTGSESVVVTPTAPPDNEAAQVVTYTISPASVGWALMSFDTNSGTVSFSATNNASGSQNFTLQADDGQSQNNLFMQSFNVEVLAQADPPTIVDDMFVSTQDLADTHFVLANDSDIDGDVLQIVAVDSPTSSGGSTSINDAGTPGNSADDYIDYNPPAGFVGLDSYSYTASDGTTTVAATVQINLLSENTDTDGDGITDSIETQLQNTTHACLSINDADSDNDSLSDGLEIKFGMDPCMQPVGQTIVYVDAAGSSAQWPAATTSIPSPPGSGSVNEPTVVLIASGTYFEQLNYSSGCDNVVYAGSLDPNNPGQTAQFNSDGSPGTIIDMQSSRNSELRDCQNFSLSNIHLRDGVGASSLAGTRGGGLRVSGTSVATLDKVWMTDSVVGDQGGGLGISNNSVVTVSNSVIKDNRVTGGKGGGGIWVGANAELVLQDSLILNNRADGFGGGGLYFDPNSTGTVTNTIISGNRASTKVGGGVFILGPSANVSIKDSIISGNRTQFDGGGLYVGNGAPVFNNLLVTGNYADREGGGFFFDSSGGASVTNSTVVYNQSNAQGGGAAASFSAPTLIDNIIYANRAFSRVLTDAVEISDSLSAANDFTASYNLVESDAAGFNDVDLSNLGRTPDFVGGYYLDQNLSLGIDSGSTSAAAAAMDTYTTSINGTADSTTVDRGYHYASARGDAANSITLLEPVGNMSVSNTNDDEIVMHITTAAGNSIGAGHEVIVEIVAAPNNFFWDSPTRLEPKGILSTIAADFGNGDYRVKVDLSTADPTSFQFNVYVNGTLVDTITISLDP